MHNASLEALEERLSELEAPQTVPHPRVIIRLMQEIAYVRYGLRRDVARAASLSTRARERLEQFAPDFPEAWAMHWLIAGMQALYQSDYQQVLACVSRARTRSQDGVYLAKGCRLLARMYMELGDYDEAFAMCHEGLNHAHDAGYESIKGTFRIEIAMLYHQRGKYNRAVEEYRELITFWLKQEDILNLEAGHFNLALTYFEMKDIAAAKKHLHLSERLTPINDQGRNQVQNYMLSGRILSAEGHFESALYCFNTALSWAKDYKDDIFAQWYASIYHDIAMTYMAMGEADQAIKSLEAALEVLNALQIFSYELDADLAYVYAEIGAFEKAFYYHKRYHEAYIKQHNEVTDQRLAILQAQYDATRNRHELELANLEQLHTTTISENQQLHLEQTHLEMLERLALAGSKRNEETAEHTRRVGRMAGLIAKRLGLNEQEVKQLEIAARLHDIGKLAIPDSILLKPSHLTPQEFEIVQKHTTQGAEILAGGNSSLLRIAEVIARSHHERWDGQGYPKGLRGTDIPLYGRIVAVADVLDALCSERPYKAAWSLSRAMQEIITCSGSQFDPHVVKALREVIVQDPHPYKMLSHDLSVLTSNTSNTAVSNMQA